MNLSVVVPAYNEAPNVLAAYRRIREVLPYCEILFVNDGSTDETLDLLRTIDDITPVNLDHHGQSAALYAGIQRARHGIIATLDADLQVDPGDIPRLLEKISQGYDLVCGWRRQRRDGIVRAASSWIGNWINNRVLGMSFHDNNCPLKVFRKHCLDGVAYFDNFHRFVPYLFRDRRICELPVAHHPRVHGRSKYGIHNRLVGNLKTLWMLAHK